MNDEYLKQLEDMDAALTSAIAHSGAGEQRRRWEALQKNLRETLERARQHIAEERKNLILREQEAAKATPPAGPPADDAPKDEPPADDPPKGDTD